MTSSDIGVLYYIWTPIIYDLYFTRWWLSKQSYGM